MKTHIDCETNGLRKDFDVCVEIHVVVRIREANILAFRCAVCIGSTYELLFVRAVIGMVETVWSLVVLGRW